MVWLLFFSLIISWIAFVSYKEAKKRVNVGAPVPVKAVYFVTIMSFFLLIFLKIGDVFLSYKLLDEIYFVSIFVIVAVICWAALSFSCVGYFFLGFFSFLLDRSIKKYYLLIVLPATYMVFLVSLIFMGCA
jgi:hypothetical protein